MVAVEGKLTLPDRVSSSPAKWGATPISTSLLHSLMADTRGTVNINVDAEHDELVAQVRVPLGVAPPSDLWHLDAALTHNLHSRFVLYATTQVPPLQLETLRFIRPHYQRAVATGEGEKIHFLMALDEYMREVWVNLTPREIKVRDRIVRWTRQVLTYLPRDTGISSRKQPSLVPTSVPIHTSGNSD